MFRDFDPESNLPIDPNDPGTWTLHADSTVDMGGTSTRRVSYDIALSNRKIKYLELLRKENSSTGYAHGRANMVSTNAAELMNTMYNPISRSGYAYGYDSKMFPTRDKVSSLFDAVLGNYYKDIYEGMDPFDAALKHAQNLPYSEPVKQGIIDIINYDRNPVLDEKNNYVGRPNVPVIPEEEFNKLVEVEQLKKNPNFNVPESAVNEPKVVATEKAKLIDSNITDNSNAIPTVLDTDPNARLVPSSGNIIDDIISASDDPNFGEAFRDILNKSNFLDTEFNFPGADRPVTGSEILGNIKGVGFSEMVPPAAFESTSGNIFFNPKAISAQNDLLRQVLGDAGVARSLEASVFTTIHEIGHAGANLVGIDDSEKVASANRLMGQMPDEIATYIAQQEAIADSFAQQVRSNAGLDRYSSGAYEKLIDNVVEAQQVDLGRNLSPDEIDQLRTGLGLSGVEDVEIRTGLGSYLGINPADTENLLANINSPKLKLMSSAYNEMEQVTALPKTKAELTSVVSNILEPPKSKRSPVLKTAGPEGAQAWIGSPPDQPGPKRSSTLNVGRPISESDKPTPKPKKPKNKAPKINTNIPDDILYDDDIPYSATKFNDAMERMNYVKFWENALDEQDEAKRQAQRDRLEERDRLKAEKKRTRIEQRNQPEQQKPNRKPTLKVGEPVKGPNQTASNVVNSGTGTPQRAVPQAAVISQSPPPPPVITNVPNAVGGGGAIRSTAANIGSANASSRAVVQGVSGAKNLRVLGAAAVAGLLIGGHAMFGRTQQDNIDRRLEMQRRGIIS